jgi:hypothetical protein
MMGEDEKKEHVFCDPTDEGACNGQERRKKKQQQKKKSTREEEKRILLILLHGLN